MAILVLRYQKLGHSMHHRDPSCPVGVLAIDLATLGQAAQNGGAERSLDFAWPS